MSKTKITKTQSQTKTDFINRVAEKTSSTKKEAEIFVNTALDVLQETLAQGIDQAFAGFGSFTIKDRPERKGRNPSTGEAMTIKAKRVLVFKPATSLKEAINTIKTE